jgi:hypothetical protein
VIQNRPFEVTEGERKPPASEGREADFGWMGWRVEEVVDLRWVRLAEAEVVRGLGASADADDLGRSSRRGGFCRGARRTGCA